jgi:hypothetical protein
MIENVVFNMDEVSVVLRYPGSNGKKMIKCYLQDSGDVDFEEMNGDEANLSEAEYLSLMNHLTEDEEICKVFPTGN